MYKLTLDGLFHLFKLGFSLGLKRQTTLSDKILLEELKQWMNDNLGANL